MTKLTRTELTWIINALKDRSANCRLTANGYDEYGTIVASRLLIHQAEAYESTAEKLYQALNTSARRIEIV